MRLNDLSKMSWLVVAELETQTRVHTCALRNRRGDDRQAGCCLRPAQRLVGSETGQGKWDLYGEAYWDSQGL